LIRDSICFSQCKSIKIVSNGVVKISFLRTNIDCTFLSLYIFYFVLPYCFICSELMRTLYQADRFMPALWIPSIGILWLGDISQHPSKFVHSFCFLQYPLEDRQLRQNEIKNFRPHFLLSNHIDIYLLNFLW